jgi:hypothetical protein
MSGLSTLESGAASSALAPSRNHTRLPNGNGRVHRSAGHPTPYSVVEWFRSATEVLAIYIHTSIHPSIHTCMHACMHARSRRPHVGRPSDVPASNGLVEGHRPEKHRFASWHGCVRLNVACLSYPAPWRRPPQPVTRRLCKACHLPRKRDELIGPPRVLNGTPFRPVWLSFEPVPHSAPGLREIGTRRV